MASLTATRARAALRGPFDATAPLEGDAPIDERATFDCRPGDLLGNRYRIERLLARGGMADAYVATDGQLQRPVVVKVACRDPFEIDAASEHLLREARLTARLQHPNIATVHDHGRTADGVPFVVLELVTGTSLRQFLAHAGPLAWRTAVVLASQIASGLRAAHARGVVHCDLTPSNVLVARTDQGRFFCKLIDFGIAEQEFATRRTPIRGTNRYAAPETRGGGPVRADVRLDLYALGEILAEMIGEEAVDAPASLHALIRSLRAPESKSRIPTADATLEALQRIGNDVAQRPHGAKTSTVPAPSRLAWAVAGTTIALGVGALVTAVSLRGTSGIVQGANLVPARAAPLPVRAELQAIDVRVPVATPDVPVRDEPAPRAARPVRAKLPSPPVPTVTPRRALEVALVADRGSTPREVSLDPSERSARVVYRDPDVVQYWVLRDGRWQLLGD